MPDIRKNPPCGKNCPDRHSECHGGCGRYRAWRAEMDRIMDERNAGRKPKRAFRKTGRSGNLGCASGVTKHRKADMKCR